MKEVIFKKIDAFADGLAAGNPAGVVYLQDEKLSDDEMQLIAYQLKGFVSEVVYLTPVQRGQDIIYDLKYFSSEREVEFCGHGTVACMYDYIKTNSALLNKKTITINTRKGELSIFNDINGSNSIFITAPAPEYLPTNLSVQEIALNLGIDPDFIDAGQEIALVNGGLKTLIVPIRSFKQILKINPQLLPLQDFCLNNNIDIIHVNCREVYHKANAYRTRVFAPKYGYLEDPATGSGNCAFGYYLLKRKHWDGELISIEQGTNIQYPNIVKLGTSYVNNIQHTIFGGNAVVRIDGKYLLY